MYDLRVETRSKTEHLEPGQYLRRRSRVDGKYVVEVEHLVIHRTCSCNNPQFSGGPKTSMTVLYRQCFNLRYKLKFHVYKGLWSK